MFGVGGVLVMLFDLYGCWLLGVFGGCLQLVFVWVVFLGCFVLFVLACVLMVICGILCLFIFVKLCCYIGVLVVFCLGLLGWIVECCLLGALFLFGLV